MKSEVISQSVLEVLIRVAKGRSMLPRLGSAVVAAKRRGLITEYPYRLTPAGEAVLAPDGPMSDEGGERLLRAIYDLM